ncbi:MAG TPA: ABC transporter ATP-binding protein [Vicinamibacterales bacterium]|nr:ABC transporter ATP-binding protein [Vicinamibacterales bacterium]
MLLAAYLNPHKTQLLIVVVTSLGISLTGLLPPTITRWIVDEALSPAAVAVHGPGDRVRLLGTYVVALLGVRVLGWTCEWIHGWTVAALGARVTGTIRSQLYQHLEMRALVFFDGREVSALTSRITTDAATLQDFLVRGVPYLLINGLTLIGILAVMLSMNWQLAVAVVVPVPIVWISAAIFWRRMRLLFARWSESSARFSAQLAESLSGAREVKAFGQQQREIARFARHNEDLVDRTVDTARNRAVLVATMTMVSGVAVVTLWLFGGIRVVRGSLTLGGLVAFYNYLLLFYNPVQWFGQFSDWMTRALASSERMLEILDAPTEEYDKRHCVPMGRASGHVTFRNVTFGYEVNRRVLDEISLEAAPGEMIGIVGRSGAGKTTMMSLLCRFYDVDHGSIELDGVNIRRIRLEDLRRQIGIVLQEPVLFSGTIRDNISYGRPDASLDDIVAAARLANAHIFILSRPDAYDSDVGERGAHLSVGERQRIAIARAILRDPRILILDEATASVDALSEQLIQEAVGRLARHRTTFVIAHRLSTLKRVDRIVVLDGGRIRERGSYQELLGLRGLFHTLVNLQQQPAEIVLGA